MAVMVGKTDAEIASLAPVQSVAGKTGSVTLSTSDISGLTTALSAKADLVGGYVPSSQISAIAITEYLGSVSTEAAMLALVGDRGDWCIRTDTSTAWVLSDDDSTLVGSWIQIPHPQSPVLSVNGQTGAVVLGYVDVGAQASDATLTALAGVSTAANKLIYATGSDIFTTTDLSAFGRTLIDDADASTAKTTIGLGSVTNDVQTKAAVVPNTVPSAGQLHIGNAGGTAFGVVSMSGDATINSSGVITVSTVGGVAVQAASGNLTATITTNTPCNLSSGVLTSNGSDIDVVSPSTSNRVLTWNGTSIAWGSVQNPMIGVSVDASKISTGVVSNAEFNRLDGATEDIQPRLDSLKIETTGIHDTAPVVGSIYIDQKAQVARTINGLYGLRTTSGTCTLSVKINGTAVTGLSALSVTSTPQDATASSANTVASGDVVTLEYTAVSSPVDLRATLKATRT